MLDHKLPRIRFTQDGSPTLQLPDSAVTYHSIFGALSESKHVFMANGLEKVKETKPSEIQVLEVGFGTGLNAALAMIWARKNKIIIHYRGLEPYPLPESFWNDFPWKDLPDDIAAVMRHIHLKRENSKIVNFERSTIQLDDRHVEEFKTCDVPFDVVFYDAFAPTHQPELWTKGLFKQLLQLVRPGGSLVTYCSKGSVRRNLMAAGWQVEPLPGPVGKKEMLRAIHHPVLRFNVRVYGIIVDAGGNRVLVCNERFDDGSTAQKFPGGGVELGEGILEAWWRECEEELGIRPEMKRARLLCTSESFLRSEFRPDDQLVALYYLFQIKADEDVPWTEEFAASPLGESNIKVGWRSIAALDFKTFRFPSDQSAVQMLKEQQWIK